MAKQTLTIEFRGKDKPEIDGKFSKWVEKNGGVKIIKTHDIKGLPVYMQRPSIQHLKRGVTI